MKKLIVFIIVLFAICPYLIATGCVDSKSESVNAVVLVEFSDTQTPFSENDMDILNGCFGKNEGVLHSVIYDYSEGKVSVNSNPPEKITVDQSIDYFMPRYELNLLGEYEEVNPIGYDNRNFDENGNPTALGGKPSAERFYREQELVYLVSSLAKTRIGKNDELNSLIIIPSKLDRYLFGQELFWPHTTSYFLGSDISSAYYTEGVEGAIKEAKLGDKSINKYILMPYSFIKKDDSVRYVTLCHEYMHVLGAPDLYSYDGNLTEFVGSFDLMGESSDMQKDPSQPLSYTRYRMGWLEEGVNILPVAKSGEYTLFPTTSEQDLKAYKIVLPEYYDKGESFYLEHRTADSAGVDLKESDSGIIIYRVNENNGYITPSGEYSNYWYGNAYGNPEVYVFRFWRELFGVFEERSEITKNGICYATITDKLGYTTFGNTESKVNAISYSDGTNSGVTINYLRENADGSITVQINLPETTYDLSGKEGIVQTQGNRLSLFFGERSENTDAYVVYSSKKVNKPNVKNLLSGKYGEVKVYGTAFLEIDLPKYTGYERFVYYCYCENGEFSKVKTIQLKGIKNISITTVIIISIAVGVLVPTVASGILKIKNLKRRTIDERGENEQ